MCQGLELAGQEYSLGKCSLGIQAQVSAPGTADNGKTSSAWWWVHDLRMLVQWLMTALWQEVTLGTSLIPCG